MSETQETLLQYVGDMLSLTNHIHEAIERQKADERVQAMPDANRLVNKIDGVLEAQILTLEAHMKTLGGDPTAPVKSAIASIAGVAAGLYDKVRTDPVSKMLRDDYTALSLASISQTMLHTTGLALKSQATATLAQQQLMELSPLVVEISEIMPRLVVPELIDAGEVVDTGVADKAIANTQKAWSRENTK